MRQTKIIPLLLAAIITAGCANNAAREQSAKAEAQIEAAYKQKDYNRITLLADSLRQLGQLSDAKAYYWQGYASDRTNKKRMAEFYWKASLEAPTTSTHTQSRPADWPISSPSGATTRAHSRAPSPPQRESRSSSATRPATT